MGFMDERERMRSVRHSSVHNRIGAVIAHAEPYWSGGISRLAQDAGVSKSAICRLVNGRANPSFALVWKIARALETGLGKPLELSELVSLDGMYPTNSVCALCGCSGCQISGDSHAIDELDPRYAKVRDGEWSFPPG
jgi:transcriptional regulator with XRE-family HTH domain